MVGGAADIPPKLRYCTAGRERPHVQNPLVVRPPKYRLHKARGLAVVTVRLPGGTRRTVYLGRYGSPESRAEYARVIAELRAGPPPDTSPTADPTVNELLLAYWRFAQTHYRRPDGTPTNEQAELRHALRPLRELYGHTPAARFGPLALKSVRQAMVDAGLCRTLVNQRVGKVRRVFKWAVAEELVPAAVFHALAAVPGPQKRRTAAREAAPVEPVPVADVEAVLARLSPEVGGLVRVQLLTGMRPGEACRLRPVDLDTSGPVWVYRPPQHKTAHRGKARAVPIGPRAQAVLNEYRPADPADYFFSPRRAAERVRALRAAARKTPRWPSHRAASAAKRVRHPKRSPGPFFTASSYGHAAARGCRAAEVGGWHPNRLRHTFATRTRQRYGLEAAQAVLGHAKADVTQVYAERDFGLAARFAAETG